MVFAHADVCAGVKLSTTLTHDDRASRDQLTAESFHTEHFWVGITPVSRRKGVLQRIPGAARAYKIVPEVLSDTSETVIRYEGPGEDAIAFESVKFAGSIAAGFPDYTESSGVLDSMQVPLAPSSRRRAPESFALRVRGDSMIDADINDGDTVIIEPGVPKHGDIVAALIDGETTLKRLIKQGSKVYLKAENQNYPDLIPTTSLPIQGIAKSVMKRI